MHAASHTYSRRVRCPLDCLASLMAGLTACSAEPHTCSRVGCATRLPRLPATAGLDGQMPASHLYTVVGCSANLLRPACDNPPPIETASIAPASRARAGCALPACRALPATAELVPQMHTASHTYSRRRSLLRCMLHHTPTRVGCAAHLTLVGMETTMWTRPCPGRGTCSGGPRGPPGGVLRVVICSSTLKLPVPPSFALGGTNSAR